MLNQYLKLATDAHAGTSHSPDRRGRFLITEYSQELEGDINALRQIGATTADIERYQTNYEQRFTAWLSAKSRCISTMIAGPSNFPVRRARKASDAESRRYDEFRQWRMRAQKAIRKSTEPERTFESEIDRLNEDLRKRKEAQELYKQINAVLRKAKNRDVTAELLKLGLREKTVASVQTPDYAGRKGIPPYLLRNNLASIKRIEARVKELEDKKSVADDVQFKETAFQGGRVILNYEADRLQILYDEKPDADARTTLKRSGFRWAPSNEAWQRKLTTAAMYSTEKLLNINLFDKVNLESQIRRKHNEKANATFC